MTVVGVVGDLYRYPVKSMQGERVERLALTATGAEGDRLHGVFDAATGKVLTAKRTGALLDASAALDDRTGAVTITLPDGTTHDAADPSIHETLSAWLDRDVRLGGPTDAPVAYELLMDPVDDASEVWDFATPERSLVDLAAAHVLTTASLAEMARLAPDTDWSVRRFRPTAVVDTAGTEADGFVEDGWVGGPLTIGGATLDVFMRTPRCSLPHRAQPVNGLARDPAVSRVLTDRHGNDLGVYASITTPAAIAVGDEVAVSPS